jgi:hypothetical protein
MCRNANFGDHPLLIDNAAGNVGGVIEFDLSSVAASSLVQSASLSLWHEANAQSTAIDIHANLESWDEDSVTFGNKPSVGSVISSVATSTPNSFSTWPVTSSVTPMIAGTQPNYGWQFVGADSTPDPLYASSSAAISTQRPELCLEYCKQLVCMFVMCFDKQQSNQ